MQGERLLRKEENKVLEVSIVLRTSMKYHPLLSIMLTFAEFSCKPFIRRACTSPIDHPAAVLTFFFGANFLDNEQSPDMQAGKPLKTMPGIWYRQNDDYDALCRNSFSDAVRKSGNGELAKQPEWNSAVDGVISQILLCDQLSRNCFRGTEEAFRYDAVAEELTLKLLKEYQSPKSDRMLPGEYYPPYVYFMILPLMHSEKLENHELGLELIESCQQVYGEERNDEDLAKLFGRQKGHLLEHKMVLDRFGRYPHRNSKLGRTSTLKEEAWLEDVNNLPGWAKSQG
jgi:uncharacterized protein (DUF924 family)